MIRNDTGEYSVVCWADVLLRSNKKRTSSIGPHYPMNFGKDDELWRVELPYVDVVMLRMDGRLVPHRVFEDKDRFFVCVPSHDSWSSASQNRLFVVTPEEFNADAKKRDLGYADYLWYLYDVWSYSIVQSKSGRHSFEKLHRDSLGKGKTQDLSDFEGRCSAYRYWFDDDSRTQADWMPPMQKTARHGEEDVSFTAVLCGLACSRNARILSLLVKDSDTQLEGAYDKLEEQQRKRQRL